MSKKSLHVVLFCAFLLTSVGPMPQARAQGLGLPVAGTMLSLSKPYMPVTVKGIMVHPEHPFKFDFLVDSGDTGLKGDALKSESMKMIKYFLAALTVPEEDMWVNLSPYEKDRIIPKVFGDTEMGRDLLAQDYILKQLTASLTYPEKEMGKTFWDKVYAQAQEKFGTTDVPVNTFNKVWIVPQKASIHEHGNGAFIIESHLKVMLDKDYLAQSKNQPQQNASAKEMSIQSSIVKEIIIPAIEKEVNEGTHFANLRQIYQAMILATWYKIRLKDSILGKLYVDQHKTKGVALAAADKKDNAKIYQQYLKAFKKGVYNYIKEDTNPLTKETMPRKYVSGGAKPVTQAFLLDEMNHPPAPGTISRAMTAHGAQEIVEWQVNNRPSKAMITSVSEFRRLSTPARVKRRNRILRSMSDTELTVLAKIFDKAIRKALPAAKKRIRKNDLIAGVELLKDKKYARNEIVANTKGLQAVIASMSVNGKAAILTTIPLAKRLADAQMFTDEREDLKEKTAVWAHELFKTEGDGAMISSDLGRRGLLKSIIVGRLRNENIDSKSELFNQIVYTIEAYLDYSLLYAISNLVDLGVGRDAGERDVKSGVAKDILLAAVIGISIDMGRIESIVGRRFLRSDAIDALVRQMNTMASVDLAMISSVQEFYALPSDEQDRYIKTESMASLVAWAIIFDRAIRHERERLAQNVATIRKRWEGKRNIIRYTRTLKELVDSLRDNHQKDVALVPLSEHLQYAEELAAELQKAIIRQLNIDFDLSSNGIRNVKDPNNPSVRVINNFLIGDLTKDDAASQLSVSLHGYMSRSDIKKMLDAAEQLMDSAMRSDDLGRRGLIDGIISGRLRNKIIDEEDQKSERYNQIIYQIEEYLDGNGNISAQSTISNLVALGVGSDAGDLADDAAKVVLLAAVIGISIDKNMGKIGSIAGKHLFTTDVVEALAKRINLIARSNAAMVTASKTRAPYRSVQQRVSYKPNASFTRGGIDLNSKSLDLQIKRDEKGMPLPVQFQNLDQFKFDALYPVILNVTPAAPAYVLGLLGLDQKTLPQNSSAPVKFSKFDGPYLRREMAKV